MSLIVVSEPWPRPGNRLNLLLALPCLSSNTARQSHVSSYAPRIQGAPALPPLADGPCPWVAGLGNAGRTKMPPSSSISRAYVPTASGLEVPDLSAFEDHRLQGSRSFTRPGRRGSTNGYDPYTWYLG